MSAVRSLRSLHWVALAVIVGISLAAKSASSVASGKGDRVIAVRDVGRTLHSDVDARADITSVPLESKQSIAVSSSDWIDRLFLGSRAEVR